MGLTSWQEHLQDPSGAQAPKEGQAGTPSLEALSMDPASCPQEGPCTRLATHFPQGYFPVSPVLLSCCRLPANEALASARIPLEATWRSVAGMANCTSNGCSRHLFSRTPWGPHRVSTTLPTPGQSPHLYGRDGGSLASGTRLPTRTWGAWI